MTPTPEAAGDLAPWLRDWRMETCEHYPADICSPCLRDHILASDWLAAHDAQVAEKALRDAAREIDFEWEVFVAGDGISSIRQHGKSPATLLNERADRLSKETHHA